MSSKIKVRQVVKYNGHSASANGAINLSLKASYSDLTETIQLFQMLNNDVTIRVKVPGSKSPITLGIFRIKQITIDGDGESKIKFNGLKDFIEVDELNKLPTNDEDNKEFVVVYGADIEQEDDDE